MHAPSLSPLVRPQQPPREEPEPDEPGDACSPYRRTVADHAEEDAHSHHDGHGEERRKPQVVPLREPSEREPEHRRHHKEERRRDTGFDPVRVGLPGRVLAAVVHAATVEPEQPVEERTHGEDPEGNHSNSPRERCPDDLPVAERQRDEEQPRQVGAELVVEPRLVRRERAQVADVVVDDALRVRLG
jgi:hypothetical protein